MSRSLRPWAAGIAAAIVLAIAPAWYAFGAGSLTATFTTTSDWTTAHEVRVTVTNGTSAPVDNWRIEFDLATTINSFWDADVVRSGNHYVATKKSWAGPLAPGASFSWGYIAAGVSRAPTGCTVNGGGCGGGTVPTNPPSSSNPPSPSPSTSEPPPPPPPPGTKVVGYFTEWGVYGRNYHVKNIATSGTAAKLTHINYAFGNVTNGQCAIGDSYAAYDKAYTAADSVDGVADTWDNGALRGNFNQLRKLKRQFPNLRVVWSFGGWTWSGGFPQAAQNAAAFADSCYRLVEDPRWADVFDGIDIDWEYPGACGLSCDTTTGFNGFRTLMQALRSRFGTGNLVTAAITADGTSGGKIDAADYAGAAASVNWYLPMTYDYFGTWAASGPTAPHSPLNSYAGIPTAGFYADAAIQKLRSKGIPANKLLLGIGFYGRGWTGVTQSTPGGSATGAAPGTYEAGNEDYKVLKTRCPATGTVAGTAYGKCGNEWWSYDTPSTIGGKMSYARTQGLGGAFFWEMSGDTGNGELIAAMRSGLG